MYSPGPSPSMMAQSQQLVKNATDPSLDAPDWTKNMDLCDMINSAKDDSEADHAARCIHRRLQESDARIISLALVLAETCMKNCRSFAKVVDQPFMDEMVGVTRGTKGRENGKEALRMIQEWAKGLPQKQGGHSAFHDTYRAMKARGVSFPETDQLDAIFDIPTQTDAVQRPRVDVEFSSKLEQDLHEVYEKIKLCREMLAESPGIASDDALSEVIGFLEACRDRMADVIEAGTLGMLNDGLLTQCFRVNDAIFRTLEAEKHGYRIPIEDDPNGMDDQFYVEPSSTLKQAAGMDTGGAQSSSILSSPGIPASPPPNYAPAQGYGVSPPYGSQHSPYGSQPPAYGTQPPAYGTQPPPPPHPISYTPPPPPPPPPAYTSPAPAPAPANDRGTSSGFGMFRGSRF